MPRPHSFSRALVWIPFALCLSLHIALVVGQAAAQNRYFFRFPYFLNLLLLGITLLTLLIPNSRETPFWKAARSSHVIAVILIIAFGVWLRTVDFASYLRPDSSAVEECQTGSTAYRSIVDNFLDPYFPITDLLAEIGIYFGGSSMNAIRVPFVVLSVSGICFFFWAARAFFRSGAVALGVTLLFSANAYLAASGRIAMETFAPIATTTLAMAACFHARNRFTPFSWGLAGIAIGLLWQEYFAYRLVSAVLLFFMVATLTQGPPIAHLVNDSRRWLISNLWQSKELLIVLIAMTAATVGPMIVADLQLPSPGGLIEGLNRYLPITVEAASKMSFAEFTANEAGKIWQTMGFVFAAPGNDIISETTGFFSLLGGVAVSVGFGWCLVTSFRRTGRLLLVGLPIAAVTLSTLIAPHVQRYRVLCVVPFLILGIGVVFDDLFAGERRSWAYGAFGLMLIGIVAGDTTRLFRDALHNEKVIDGFSDPFFEFAKEIRATQVQNPGCVVFVADESLLLRRPKNDYELFYDRGGIRLVGSFKYVPPNGIVVAWGWFNVDKYLEEPGLVVLKRYKPTNLRGEILVGRMAREPF